MYITYKHRSNKTKEDKTLFVSLSDITLSCADVVLQINEAVDNITSAGVILYKDVSATPDVSNADETIVFTNYQRGDNTETMVDLSSLSYESVTDTSTKEFLAYGYVQYADGTYAYSDGSKGVFAPNTLTDGLQRYYETNNGSVEDMTGNDTSPSLHNTTEYDAVRINGKSGLYFDGATSYMLYSKNLGSNISHANSAMSVFMFGKDENSLYNDNICTHYAGFSAITEKKNPSTTKMVLHFFAQRGAKSSNTRKTYVDNLTIDNEYYGRTHTWNSDRTVVQGAIGGSALADLTYTSGRARSMGYSDYSTGNIGRNVSGRLNTGTCSRAYNEGVMYKTAIYNRMITSCEHRLLNKKGKGLPYSI